MKQVQNAGVQVLKFRRSVKQDTEESGESIIKYPFKSKCLSAKILNVTSKVSLPRKKILILSAEEQ